MKHTFGRVSHWLHVSLSCHLGYTFYNFLLTCMLALMPRDTRSSASTSTCQVSAPPLRKNTFPLFFSCDWF